MSAPDYIPCEGSGSEGSQPPSPTLGKRKSKTPTPDPDSREQKRLRLGDDRPSRISSGGENSSSPLSSIPSEKVPTQFGFNILQAEREAHAANYDSDYHGFALQELKNAIERFESINVGGLLNDDAISYLVEKLRDNVKAKYNQVMTISDSPSTTTSKDTQASTPPASSDVEPKSPEFDVDSLFAKELELVANTADAATNTDTTTTTSSPSSAAAASTYKSTGTNPDTKTALSSYTEASIQTTPISTPAPSNTELWSRQLRLIRRSKRIVSANSPITIVKCQIRKVQKNGYKKKPAAAAMPRDIIDLGDDSSPVAPIRQQKKEKKSAPVTIDLLSSDDEDDVELPSKKDIRRGNDDREPPSALKVGGAGYYGMNNAGVDDDIDNLLPRPAQSADQGSRATAPFAAAANAYHDVESHDTTTHNPNPNSNSSPTSSGSGSNHTSFSLSLPPQSDLWEQEKKQQDQAQKRRKMDFYGLPRTAQALAKAHTTTAAERRKLRYQDNRDGYAGPKPGPRSGHQLRLEEYHRDIRSMHRRDPGVAIESILEQTSWGGAYDDHHNPTTSTTTSSSDDSNDGKDEGIARDDDDDAEAQRWLSDPDVSIMRGFPLMEDVRFIVSGNNARSNGRQQPNGDCYWRALSRHLYGGTDAHWDLVKAEHLGFVHHVLRQASHPRHALYARELNARFVNTASPAPGGSFKANLWQTLHLAHAWTPALMQQVTADLYGVCVVMFSVRGRSVGGGEGEGESERESPGHPVIIDSDDDDDDGDNTKKTVHEVTETTMRGSYNSRHLFLLYTNGCHYQPMIPADHYASEFQFPMPTPAGTAKYRFAPKAVGEKGALEHAWRREFTATAPLPVPRLHGCDVDDLRYYMGSRREV